MRTIHRYLIGIRYEQRVRMPLGALPLFVADSHQAPGHMLDLWALIDTDAPEDERVICVFGTGNLIEVEPGRHVGSVLIHRPGGPRAVWHVFDRGSAVR